jgi:hypothetical protein
MKNQEYINQLKEDLKPIDQRLHKLAKEVEEEQNNSDIILWSTIANTGSIYVKRMLHDIHIRISDHMPNMIYKSGKDFTREEINRMSDNQIKQLIREELLD